MRGVLVAALALAAIAVAARAQEPRERLSVVVCDAAGAPLEGATVEVRVDPQRAWEPARRTADDGRVTIEVPTSGSWWVRVQRAGYLPHEEEDELDESGAWPLTVRLARSLSLDVRVADTAGRPLAGVLLRVPSPPGGFVEAGPTDAAGRARLEGVPAGQLPVTLVEREGPTTRVLGLVATLGETPLELRLPERSARLRLRVASGGRATAGAPVGVAPVAGREALPWGVVALTDGEGTAELALAPGDYQVGCGPSVQVRAVAGETTDVALEPARGLVAVRVLQERGWPLAGVAVLRPLDGERELRASLDPFGLAAWTEVPPGRYRAVVTSDDVVAISDELVVSEGAPGPFPSLVATSAARLDVSILRPDGAPARPVVVEGQGEPYEAWPEVLHLHPQLGVTQSSFSSWATVHPDPAGRLTLDGGFPGDYLVVAYQQQVGLALARDVPAVAGQRTTVSLVLGPAGALVVAGAPGVRVTLMLAGAPELPAPFVEGGSVSWGHRSAYALPSEGERRYELAPSTYVVRGVAPDGRALEPVTADVRAGEATRVTLR